MRAVSQGPTQSASDGEVFWFITTGAIDKGMPSWSTLSERQRWQLVTYLKSLKNSHGAQRVVLHRSSRTAQRKLSRQS
jgi:hypothetical protein